MDKHTKAIIKFVRAMQGTGRYKRQTLTEAEPADTKKKKMEYPGMRYDMDEYSIFRMMIRQNLVNSWFRKFSCSEARRILLDAYDYRKKKFGNKDKELKEILMMYDWLREEPIK